MLTKTASSAERDDLRKHLENGIGKGGLGVGLAVDYYSEAVDEAEMAAIFEVAVERDATIFVHMRRLGRFTLIDVLSVRLEERPVRLFSACANLVVLAFYMVSQMVGAGILIQLLLGVDFVWSVICVGYLILIYVIFGGMVATTWVQITKAILLLFGTLVLSILVLLHFDLKVSAIFETAIDVHPQGVGIMGPGSLIGGVGASMSLGLTLMFGPAGLPHILMRFFTVPDVKQARRSALTAIVLIGGFTLLMIVIGYGTIGVLTNDPRYVDETGSLIGGSNMAALYLADALGGSFFLGFLAAVAFATILAVVSGLTLAAAATLSHDLYGSLLRKGTQTEAEELRVSRISALLFGVFCIGLSIAFKDQNITFLSVFAFSIAASATFPVLILALYWSPLTTLGAVTGGCVGLLSALICLIISPSIWVSILGNAEPIFAYQYPTILAMPLAFTVAMLVSKFYPSS